MKKYFFGIFIYKMCQEDVKDQQVLYKQNRKIIYRTV